MQTPAATTASGTGRLVLAADKALGRCVELVAVALIILEVVILFSGVAARYILHVPLVWTDELASILFLWLSMLGAVIALRRGQHMRMTAFIDRVSPRQRLLLEGFAYSASLAFLLLFLYPAFEYAYEESYIVTPALEISNAWHAAALPAGIALMILTSVFRMVISTDRRQMLISAGVTLTL
ncbi:MAG: TRAP transporter small permease, partial [Advenella sp.]